MKKTATLVIARYKEDLSWVYSITNPDIELVILNKSKDKLKMKPLINNNKVKIIYLANIGREAHSFIYYVSTFYNQLSDYTIFVQGHPFDHYKDLLGFINQKQYNGFKSLNDQSIVLSENGKSTEKLFRSIIDYPIKQQPHEYGFKFKFIGFHFPCGAQFCVPRNYLLNRPRVFWQSLLKYPKWKSNEELPYYFERFFILLYDPYYKINPSYLKKIALEQ